MKAGLITMFLLVLTGLVAGCGQKGSLYREPPAPAQANGEPAADSTDQKVPDDER